MLSILQAVSEGWVLFARGEADTHVIPSAQAAYVETECATGTTPDYRTYPGSTYRSPSPTRSTALAAAKRCLLQRIELGVALLE
jgi:hypothetical protein